VCYGVSTELYRFWRRAGYEPVYIRQSVNDLTAEHSCVMLHPLTEQASSQIDISVYSSEFRKRFSRLLSYDFRGLEIQLVLEILKPDLTTE
jgi:N-acetyltransferase 10